MNGVYHLSYTSIFANKDDYIQSNIKANMLCKTAELHVVIFFYNRKIFLVENDWI